MPEPLRAAARIGPSEKNPFRPPFCYKYPLRSQRARGVCVCVCVCVCAVQSIFESILEHLSISIYLCIYPSKCSWSLSCQRCLCWSLPFVCVYYCSTYDKAVRVGGGVCVSLSCNYLALVVSLCCSTGVDARQVFAAEH